MKFISKKRVFEIDKQLEERENLIRENKVLKKQLQKVREVFNSQYSGRSLLIIQECIYQMDIVNDEKRNVFYIQLFDLMRGERIAEVYCDLYRSDITEEKPDIAHLLTNEIKKPQNRGKGLGTFLIGTLEKELKKINIKKIHGIFDFQDVQVEKFYLKNEYKINQNTGSFSKKI